MNTIILFFELIQIAIGNRNKLSYLPSEEEWASIYATCKKQSLLGVSFVGVNRLQKEQRPCIELFVQWMNDAIGIKEHNRKILPLCCEVSNLLSRDGLKNCILKGQGNLINYSENLRKYRNCGDIDVWAAPFDKTEIPKRKGKFVEYAKLKENEGIIEYALLLARQAHIPVPIVRYNHVRLSHVWDYTVEIHYRPSFLNCMYRNRRFQQWCIVCLHSCVVTAKIDGYCFPVPNNSFNVIYQISHMYCHLFDEGIGMRQLLDYYFVIMALHSEQEENCDRIQSLPIHENTALIGILSNEAIMWLLQRFGMKKFMMAVMYVLQTVFAMPNQCLICEPDEIEGRFLLNEIMLAGNFGKNDNRILHSGNKVIHAWEKTKHNLRLFTHYPEEVTWEPIFRVYHWMWRKLEMWRW